ncbi:MAG TPA: hypothetical protein VHA52_04725 [Candidatus Babeliaceae bacterium]|nr:hypothetical protein [Candidatus Babeliaceae bacterium]
MSELCPHLAFVNGSWRATNEVHLIVHETFAMEVSVVTKRIGSLVGDQMKVLLRAVVAT